MLRGAWVDPHAGRITLEEYATTWLATRPGLRLRTRETYESQLRRHVLPALGPVNLNALTPRFIREWYGTLVASKSVGANTAAKCYRLLRTILGTAVHDELIVSNPCKLAGAGVERAAERPTATVMEVLAAADAMPPHMRLLVLVAGFCGLRVGELLGLERRHVNLLHGLLTVEQQEHQLSDGRLVLGPPKSEAGRRTIAVPPFLMADIEAHLESFTVAQAEARVFRGLLGGALRRHVIQKHWARARSAAGLPATFRFHAIPPTRSRQRAVRAQRSSCTAWATRPRKLRFGTSTRRASETHHWLAPWASSSRRPAGSRGITAGWTPTRASTTDRWLEIRCR